MLSLIGWVHVIDTCYSRTSLYFPVAIHGLYIQKPINEPINVTLFLSMLATSTEDIKLPIAALCFICIAFRGLCFLLVNDVLWLTTAQCCREVTNYARNLCKQC